MAEQGLVFIELMLRSISRGENTKLNNYLSRIRINALSIERADVLLTSLLDVAYENRNTEAIRIIITAFETNYTDFFDLPILNRILMDLRIEDETVAFVLEQYPEHSYAELVNNYIGYRDTEDLISGLTRLEALKGPLKYEEYEELHSLALGKYNTTTAAFLAQLVEDHAPYAEIPSWLKNFVDEIPYEDEIVLPDVNQTYFALPDDETIVEILTSGLDPESQRLDPEYQLSEDKIREDISLADAKQKAEKVRPILERNNRADLASDPNLFAILGPANAIAGSDLDAPDERYGGCRMFTCIEFEDFMDPSMNIVYDLSEYTGKEWFTGACQVCHLKIRRLWHSLRIPLDHGGWKGCYCSEKCARQSVDLNVLSSVLLDQVIDDLNRIGIQDRYPVPEKREEEEAEEAETA